MQKIHLVTGNPKKVLVAKEALAKYGIDVDQVDIETPEIQAETTDEIVKYSAKYAAEKSGKAVIKGDFGFYIEALNGFPGPFVKFINKWLTAEELIRLYKDKENKRAHVLNALGFCTPGSEPVVFVTKTEGILLTEASGDNGNPVDALFVPDGFDKTIASMSQEEYIKLWDNDRFERLSQYLKENFKE